MMRFKTIILFVLITGIFSFLMAQTPDTVMVDPGKGTLNEAINNPENQGKVFKLESGPDAIYITTDILNNVGWHLHIVGEKSKEIPPRIVRDADKNKRRIFTAEGDITLENLFIIYRTLNGEKSRKSVIEVAEDSVNVTIKGIIQTDGRGVFIEIEDADMVNLEVTDCMMFNSYHPTKIGSGGWFVWIQGEFTGSYYIANNTVFNVTGPVILNHWSSPDLVKNLVVEHNTFYLVPRAVFEKMYAVQDYIIKNNLIIDGYCRGYVDEGRYQGMDYVGDFVEPFDPNVPGNEMGAFFPVDTLATEWGIAEDTREIKVHHNLRYETEMIRNWWDEVDAVKHPWLTTTGEEMFNNYEKFVFHKNININPEFTQPLPDEMTQKMIDWYDAIRKGLETPDRTWDPDGDGDPFTFPWPLPLDLSYDHAKTLDSEGYHLAGDDGYPLGDLNWFPEMKKEWQAGNDGPLVPLMTSVENKNTRIVDNFTLSQNYPNPFNPATTIEYNLRKSDHVILSVYNMLGQKIRTLVNTRINAGNHSVTWNGTDDQGQNVGSGIYYARIESADEMRTIKMVLIR